MEILSIWLSFTLHFGFGGRQEHYTIQIEDFSIQKANSGTKYITFFERIGKSRQRLASTSFTWSTLEYLDIVNAVRSEFLNFVFQNKRCI